jgi:SAM-dependent methyltransferase
VSEIGDLVRGHYARSELEQAILTALEEAGIDSSAPVAEAIFPIDQLHAGGAQATRYLLEQLQLGPMTQLLDIGCGIGGPARMAAALFSCPVVGVDLSEDFINAGRRLTERVRLDDLVKLTVAWRRPQLPRRIIRTRHDDSCWDEHPGQASGVRGGTPSVAAGCLVRSLRANADRRH